MSERPQHRSAAPTGQPVTPRNKWAGRVLGGIDAAKLEAKSGLELNQQMLDTLVGITAQLQAMHDNVKIVRRRILWSGTAQIGPTGVWHRRLPQGSMAIAVTNYTSNGLVTVAAGAPLGAAPGLGAGIHQLPAGAFQVFNGDTTDWTLYGTATNVLDVQIFSLPISPAAAGNI